MRRDNEFIASINLPALTSGLAWNTSQLDATGVLSVVNLGVPGDYNNNSVVDAADFVVLRANLGTNNVLPNDPSAVPSALPSTTSGEQTSAKPPAAAQVLE